MKQFAITALGELLIDYTPMQISPAGMPVFEQNPGGAPANVLVCASRLGCRTAFIGEVGADDQGRFLRKTLEKEGVDTRGLMTDENSFTTLAFVNLSESGERSFSFARKPGADTQLTASQLDRGLLRNTEILHVGSLSMTHEPARSATLYAISEARGAGAVISYDPNYRPLLWDSPQAASRGMRALLPYVDIMKCSDDELEVVTGEFQPEKAMDILLGQGISCVMITMGAKGTLACSGEGTRFVKSFPSHAVDTTGAGDSFWGGFLCKLYNSGKRPNQLTLDELEEFSRYGNAVASLCVERRGAMPAMPTKAEVEDRLRKLA